MIDDWVLINGVPQKVQAIDSADDEIMADDELYTFCQDRVHSEDDIQPIPLTTEILEKNGWEHDPSMERLIIDCKLFIDRERWMSWDSKYHCLEILIRDSKQLSQYNLKELRLDVPCTNVHELQHALRLCGIEKEITL
jgi:hypothetical protein